ncbi:hypothetical protein BGZ54_000947 [Gamsiella multidivaricata]|nr:hypothetical protein BGZ54_000947 [Gamsiella multidivaricata]
MTAPSHQEITLRITDDRLNHWDCKKFYSLKTSNHVFFVTSVIIDEDTALNESNPTRYAFDLVFSTSSELSPDRSNITEETPRITEKSLKDTESGKPSKNACAEQSFRDLCPEKYEDMLTFLRDPESVNTAFVFTIHSCSIRIALWAHCAILKKYPAFQELLTSHRSANTVALSYGPIVVPVEGISLTTFCVLLKYIYTEDIDLAVDDSQFLMSDMGPSDTPSDATVLNNALRERNASQFYASWEAKDKVTWVDLFLAADRFGVQKLRQHSLKSLLVSVDKHNAMEMLFGVGPHFKTEVRDPVMKYISEHLDDVFSVQTEDPFKRYADHENCHEVMLELLRLERSR